MAVSEFEVRTIPSHVRAAPPADGKGMPTFQGRAIPYNVLSQPLSDPRIGNFREIIKPGAVRKTLADANAEVKADVNHETDQIIGRRSKGTLKMQDGADGLDVSISPPDTSWARDAASAVDHGDYDGMSFEFNVNPGGERFYRDNTGTLIRELSDINLKRVSIVGEPAYTQTEVNLRSLGSIEAAQRVLAAVDPNVNLATACAAQVI